MILFVVIGAFVLLIAARMVTGIYAHSRTFLPADAPKERVAVVFGAGLRRDGSPTAVLRERVTAAAELYHAGKVEKLLMSGDNRYLDYNEPAAMHDYAVGMGVPERDIVMDYAGRRTYDTCYRARDIFGVKDVLLVTQAFHLPRAIFICNALGVRGWGVIADRYRYTRFTMLIWHLRELPATLAALLDVYVFKPLPVLGKPEPIFKQDMMENE